MRLDATNHARKKHLLVSSDVIKASLRDRLLTSFKAFVACEAVGKSFKAGIVMAAVE